jgi:hypothetical protein
MPLTNAEVDSAVPAAGEPNRALTNAALKELIADIPAAISAHEAAGDPHPGYLTAAEGNAAYQPLSANLTEYAAVNPTAQGLALLDDADAAAQRTTLGLVIGTDVDAFASTVSQAEAEAGTATTVRNWTAQRVGQAIAALAASGSAGTVHVRTGTTDTLLSTDDNDTVVYTNAGAIAVTLPAGLALTTGITVQWLAGTGTITITPTGGTTINGGTSPVVLSQAAGMVAITPTGTDAYNVVGAIGDLVIADVTDITASAAELNVLDGITASTAELNHTDGVTSPIQTQLNAKASTTQGWGFSIAAIGTVADGDIVLYLKVPAALNGATITETVSECASGTATATFKINTTALGGTANSVSSTEQAQAHASANTLATGDNIVVTISSASSLTSPRFSLSGSRSLA